MREYHLTREDMDELRFSILRELLQQLIYIYQPEKLPKPKPTIRSDVDLLSYLSSKYGV